MIPTDIRTKLIHDVGFSGGLAGKHIDQAAAEIECQRIFEHFDVYWAKRSETPEQDVARFFEKEYADPRKDSFSVTKPLPPAAPVPNKTLAERMRTEIARQYHHLQASRGTNFVPLQLGGVPSWRAEIRCLQISEHPETLKRYREALHLKP